MILYALFEIVLVILLSSPIVVVTFKRRYKDLQKLGAVLLVLYIVYAAKYFFFPIGIDRDVFHARGLGINIIPIVDLIRDFQTVSLRVFMFQVFGNIVSFMPLAFLLAIIYPKYRIARKNMLLCFIISMSIEIIQLLINIITQIANRGVEINDIILNTLGSIVGFLLYVFSEKILKLKEKELI
jgi:Glycopeptide antibiotics resistance protein